MRIVIDLQGAQTGSRFRGIGRAALCIAKAMARDSGDDEIFIALSGLFPETIADLKKEFHGLLPDSQICVWNAPAPTREDHLKNTTRRQAAEMLREAFLADLNPDVLLVTSFFEGLGDNAITSVNVRFSIPTAIILYDLIPLVSPDIHFRSKPLHRDWYRRKINQFRDADLLLAISDSTRREGIAALDCDPGAVVEVGMACDASFRRLDLSKEDVERLWGKYKIAKPFVMYTGGADERKNLARLIEAYAALPSSLRGSHQLVMVGMMPAPEVATLQKHARAAGLGADELVFTGYVDDQDLVALYNTCALFAFPSLHEGFGIPPLEAMACGAPVIAANATSLPEVVGLAEALFDPTDVAAITKHLMLALADTGFRERLIAHGRTQVSRFSWEASAKAIFQAFRRFDRGANAPKAARHITVERTTLIEPQRPKILLIKLDHLGDFLLATPAIRKLAARYPGAAIDIMVGSWNVANAKALNLFRKIHVFDLLKRGQDLDNVKRSEIPGEVKEALGFYDIAIDLRRHADTRWVLADINAKLKVGYESFDPAVDAALDIVAPSDRVIRATKSQMDRTSAAMQMTRLIDALPVRLDDYLVQPATPSRPTQSGLQLAFFPKAGHDGKEWDEDRFIALAQRLALRPDIEALNFYYANAAEAAGGPPSSGKIHVHSGLNWDALQGSLAENDICLANNSGGAHLAAYLGLTVLAIISGHDLADEWSPVFGDSYAIYSPVPCAPCHLSRRSLCPFDAYCLSSISIDDVYGRLIEAVEHIEALRAGDLRVGPSIAPKFSPDFIMSRLVEGLAPVVHNWSASELAALARAMDANHPTYVAPSLS